MQTINIIIDYHGEVTLEKEFRALAPLKLEFFKNTDLNIETSDEKITFNSNSWAQEQNGDFIVRLKKPDDVLKVIATESVKIFNKSFDLELAHADENKYLIIYFNNRKFAYRLPNL